MKIEWKETVPVLVGVFLAMTLFSLFDRFVLSKVAGHLENLIGGEGEEQ